MVSRAQKTAIGEWWWTVDRVLLVAYLLLIGTGVVMSFAASPGAAVRMGLPPFHFVERHLMFLLPVIAVLFATSFLSPRMARRICFILLIVGLAAMVATLLVGVENKGSRRWLRLLGMQIQPSEFLKPAFVVVSAWLMSETARRPGIIGNLLALALLGMVCALLVLQPDFGQTMLVVAVWGAMFFIASMPWLWVILLGTAGAGGLVAAYFVLPHVASRIDRFLHGSGDNFQVETAMQSIQRGGWFGVGPGEGTVKRSIPDSHTDFVTAVMGEEFGIAVLIAVSLVFCFVVMRGLMHALKAHDPFNRLAIAGLVTLFGLQSSINLAVNLQLMPAKGMTLPFVSYGGSSMLAVAFGTGLVLALARRRPGSGDFLRAERRPPAPVPTGAPAGAAA
jgi:cell division protein FtsW